LDHAAHTTNAEALAAALYAQQRQNHDDDIYTATCTSSTFDCHQHRSQVPSLFFPWRIPKSLDAGVFFFYFSASENERKASLFGLWTWRICRVFI
jgi:hypothetical protein